MDVTPPIPKGRQLIDAYGEGGFRIAGEEHRGSVAVLPTQTVAWTAEDISALSPESLAPIFASEEPVELLLVGCGNGFAQIPRAVREAAKARRITIDAMDTGAACRTYNILMAEGRRVAALLIAVD
ncbi:MAG: hypothetical protein FJX23_09985 [Alphaproteobacteria bacterium]|nr:hypothetical protein [Alphaproteobacteria bacterium]